LDKSIFNRFYTDNNFSDRFINDKEKAVDVIIPLLNTNELWRTNLLSFFREIPIRKLLIGDGGCTDNSIEIVKSFPRVKILEQQNYKSQGYAIKELMLNVKTDYFIYLHADVYLPDGWFDTMYSFRDKYDWFECHRRFTILFEYLNIGQYGSERAYSGSQFGNSNILKNNIGQIDDDYLQRNEDIIFMELVKQSGGKYGKVSETYHYHQTMNRNGELEPDIKSINISRVKNNQWENKIYNMQYKGIIKYLEPKDYLLHYVFLSILILANNGDFNWREFRKWTKENNSKWLKYITRRKFLLFQTKNIIKKIIIILIEETRLGSYYESLLSGKKRK